MQAPSTPIAWLFITLIAEQNRMEQQSHLQCPCMSNISKGSDVHLQRQSRPHLRLDAQPVGQIDCICERCGETQEADGLLSLGADVAHPGYDDLEDGSSAHQPQ